MKVIFGSSSSSKLNLIFLQVTTNQRGWVRTETLMDWFREVLVPFANDDPFLLIVDQYPPHRNQEFRQSVEEAGGYLEFIPGKCTSLLQPLDLSIMKAFKCNLRSIWKAWKIGHTQDDGQCPQIELWEVVRMISLAWASISPQAVRNAFRASRLPVIDDDEDELGVAVRNLIENNEASDDEELEFFDEEPDIYDM